MTRAKSKEQRAKSKEQRAKNYCDSRFECQEAFKNTDSKLHNGERKPGNLQRSEHGKRCCYCNYKRVDKIDVEVAMTILARDYKGFGSGHVPSNGVVIEYR